MVVLPLPLLPKMTYVVCISSEEDEISTFSDNPVHQDAAGNALEIEQPLIKAWDVGEAHLGRLKSG